MTKTILVSLAILTISTSVALAGQRTQSRAAKPTASAAAMNPNPFARPMNPNAAFARMDSSPGIFAQGVSNSDRELYFRSLRESGYDKKKDFNPNGTIRTQ
jgi:hypothetical protein